MKKGTKSLNVSEETHYRVSLLAKMERTTLGEWVDRELRRAAERAEKRRLRAVTRNTDG